jgi:hypothetical protein
MASADIWAEAVAEAWSAIQSWRDEADRMEAVIDRLLSSGCGRGPSVEPSISEVRPVRLRPR